MHLITILVTLFCSLTLTFAGPIIPTEPSYPATISTEKATSPSFTHYAFPTHKSEVHHSFTHTGTVTFYHEPTGTYTHPKPAGSPIVQRRVAEAEPADDLTLFVRDAGLEGDELAGALNARDGSATDGGCVWECFQITCECVNAGGKSALISKTLASLALVGAIAAILV